MISQIVLDSDEFQHRAGVRRGQVGADEPPECDFGGSRDEARGDCGGMKNPASWPGKGKSAGGYHLRPYCSTKEA